MTSTTLSSIQSPHDLRAPLLTQLSKRIGGRWRRIIILLLLDTGVLWLSWIVTANCDRTLTLLWDKQPHLFFAWGTITIQIGLIAASGLYHAGSKRRDYFGIAKSLTLAHLLILLIAFLGQLGESISRQSFILSWFLSNTLVCGGRFGINTAVNYLRQQGIIRYPIYLICSSEDKDKAVKLLEKENRYYLLGWADVNSLAKEKNHWQHTVENIYNLGVAEVFICAWKSIPDRMYLYYKLRNAGISLHVLPINLETVGQNLELKMVGQIPTFKLTLPLIIGSDFLIKRCFDFCFTTILLVLASPIYSSPV
jgi:hypothetical protein